MNQIQNQSIAEINLVKNEKKTCFRKHMKHINGFGLSSNLNTKLLRIQNSGTRKLK